jgi:hypothetical protein
MFSLLRLTVVVGSTSFLVACGDVTEPTDGGGAGAGGANGGSSNAAGASTGGQAAMRFDGSCVHEASCTELFDCPATMTRGTCPIGNTTFSSARCSTAKVVGNCIMPADRQNCGKNDFFYDVFADHAISVEAGENACAYVNNSSIGGATWVPAP